ncbi:copper resistance protein CopC [Streptomyces albus]|uniref:Copper resistance protein CopC n=1 Tax=Streptomyces albus (strain ATCC 21838 / DSM 41398 / FERM P-419 / JCM 4703 / NBRC 107858) TaxID=1081613 RepID=A0A0B5EY10_STRA4|nr:copper resistance protein CopC [Streptomyces albus]AOU78425.1 copper resistance protein CopC [Streptomyces albus]
MRSSAARRVRLLLCAIPLLAAALLLGAAPASAHAALLGSDPKKDSVVDTAPERVTLTFSEDVGLSKGSLKVLDPDGRRADSGEERGLGQDRYAVGLHAGLGDGTYTVTYQVVSADSHPVAGAFTFSIGAPSKTKVALAETTAGGGPVGTLYGIARYISYAGFVLLAGAGAFLLACWQGGAAVRPLQRLVVGGWLTLTAGTLLQLLLRGAYTTTGAFGDVLDLSLMGEVLQTKSGAALVSRLLLLATAALFIAVLFGAFVRRGEEGQADARKDLAFGLTGGGAIVAAGIASTWAMAEHASTGIQTGIAMPVDVLHLLAVATWLGGLAALLTALYTAPELPASAVRRFSPIAFGSVVVLVATGTYQSWRQVGTWSALTGTDYGRLLLVKIALVALLLGAAWFSRRWTGRLTSASAATAGTDGADGSVKGAEESAALAEEAPRTDDSGADGPGTAADRTEAVGRTEDADRTDSPDPAEAVGRTDSTDPAEAAGPAVAVAPERAAQLARQRRAVAVARSKRVRDADPHRARLRRSVLVEAGVAVVLLAVATALSATEPARTAEQSAAAGETGGGPTDGQPLSVTLPYDTGGKDGRGQVQLELDPGRTGGNELHAYARTSDGGPADLPELKLAFTLKAKDLGPLAVTPERVVAGHWTAEGVQLPVAGDWRVAVTVRTSDIDQITVYKTMKIG